MASTLLRALRPLISRSPALASTFRHCSDVKAMDSGAFEPDEVRTLEQLVPQHDVFVNNGANFGYYCCLALQQGLQVIAYEPVPGNLKYPYRNLRANGWEQRAQVHPVALGAHTGLVDIYGGGTAASLIEGWSGLPSDYCQTVPLTTLDLSATSQPLGRRCLLLIDVEGAELGVLQGAELGVLQGAELGVLQGASQLLDAEPAPVWVIEVVIDEHQPQGRKLNPQLVASFEAFEGRAYMAWLIGDHPRRVQYDEVRAVAAAGTNTFAGHNFVFAKHDPWRQP